MPTQKGLLDFDLRLSKEGDRYFAKVSQSPAGESEKVQINIQFGAEPLEALRRRLADAVTRGPNPRAFPPSKEERILREFGDQIFRAVFRDAFAVAMKFEASLGMVRQRSDELEGLRVKLHADSPELAILPWEFMFDNAMGNDDAYLCLRNRSPLVRFLDVEGPPTKLPVDGPLRILGMVSNPGVTGWPKLDVEAERERIETALKGVPKGAVDFKWVPGGSTDDLFDIMQEGPWHIFHFIGHGGVDEYVDGDQGEPSTRGYVVMQDGLGQAVKVDGSSLGVMLQGDGSLQLAVLNCCEGARGAISSAGASLVSWGMPMVVAMQFPISNGSSADFAGKFYRSLVSGQSIEHAITVTRQFMRTKTSLEWGIPVLFSRSGSSVLFHVEPAPSAIEADGGPAVAPPAAPAVNLRAREELRRLFS